MDEDQILIAARVRDYESLQLIAYRCWMGIPTIGYGHTKGVAAVDVGRRRCTKEEAEAWLADDIGDALAELDRRWPWWRRLPRGVRLVLVDMAFNLGAPRLAGFRKMLSALERGDFSTAAAEARDSRWFRQVGRRARRNVAIIAKGE